MESLKKELPKQDGKLVIVRASELEANGTKGTVAEGVLEKVTPNKFNAASNDYFIRDASNDTLYIVNGTKALNDQLGQPGLIGAKVKVDYNGKIATKNKKGFHDFSCYAEKATK
jgi:hypothetical protein